MLGVNAETKLKWLRSMLVDVLERSCFGQQIGAALISIVLGERNIRLKLQQQDDRKKSIQCTSSMLLVVLQQRHHIVILQLLAAVQERKLHHES